MGTASVARRCLMFDTLYYPHLFEISSLNSNNIAC